MRDVPRALACVLASGLLHALALLAVQCASLARPQVDLAIPREVELGFVDGAPGAKGAPALAAPPAPPPKTSRPAPRPPVVEVARGIAGQK